MKIRDQIIEVFLDILKDSDCKLLIELTDNAILLNTGMDSLGFAIMVTRLEEVLGYDPFTIMKEPYYPITFGDFVSVYENFSNA